MRHFLVFLCLIAFAAPAFAQDYPPLPRPRPDKEALELGEDGSIPEGLTLKEGETAQDAIERISGGPPEPLTLSAKITEDGPIVPNGLIWRIYSTKANASGKLDLLEKSELPSAIFSLTPGEYLVHVAYGESQASDTVFVGQEPTAKTMVLEAGGLRLNGAITGDIPIPVSQLRFDIFPGGADRDDRKPIIANARPGELIHLNAGVYHVVSKFGSINAEVRADLRVDPGQLTDATLYHHAAQISFKLVSEAGGEAIADIDWSVRDADNKVVFSNLGAFPTAVLAEGDYTVFAKRGASVYNRDFSVTPGAAREIEVLTSVY